jgi:uncharacterized membrane protein HdeD (DUF308 family)
MTQPVKNPFPKPIPLLRSQKNRRTLTILSIILSLSAPTLALFGQSTLALYVVAACLAVIIGLHFATRNIANSINSITDERERSLRDHAHRIAYWVLSGVLGGIVGLAFGFSRTREASYVLLKVGDLTRIDVFVYTMTFWALFVGLPSAIIAWLEPEPLEDE